MKPKLYLVNGPLGSGKTTLVKYLVGQPQFSDVRVIENEFANVSIDTETLHAHVKEIKTIAGACICCSTGNELTDTLAKLAKSEKPVIIEATGMANSLKLVEKIILSGQFENYQLASAIFILDGMEAAKNPAEIANHKIEMLAADLVLVSKIDLLTDEEFENLKANLAKVGVKNTQVANEGEFNLKNLTENSKIVDFYAKMDENIEVKNSNSSYTIINLDEHDFAKDNFLRKIERIYTNFEIRRIKGDAKIDGEILHLESTPNQHKISKNSEPNQARIIVIGNDARKITVKNFED